jgi:surface polysaccharide O-acyltransferase-like enzyme
MKTATKHAVLDAFRVAAAFFVVAIHVSPLQTIDATADFWQCVRTAETGCISDPS